MKLASVGGLLAALSGVDALGATYEAGVWAGAALRGRSAVEIAAPAIAVHLLSLATALSAAAIAHAVSRTRPSRTPPPELEHDHV